MFPRGPKYRVWAVIFSAASFLIANLGLNSIVAYSLPVLMLLYPLAITLILLGLFGGLFGHDCLHRRGGDLRLPQGASGGRPRGVAFAARARRREPHSAAARSWCRLAAACGAGAAHRPCSALAAHRRAEADKRRVRRAVETRKKLVLNNM